LSLLDHIFRIYRFFWQSLLWILFGLTGLLISLVILPLVALVVRNRDRRQNLARDIIRGGYRLFVWLSCKLRLVTLEVKGIEHFKPDAGLLILANHPTLIDVVILIALFSRIDCVFKEAITRNPVMRTAALAANYIPNGESATLLNSCAERLQSGSNLLLFPEGTRTVPGQPLAFKAGASEVALRSKATILPVVIDCRPQFLAKNEPWYFIPKRAPHFEIRILPPVKPGNFINTDTGKRQARQALNRALREFFETELA
jgi:1-acyl-sn-glycerol-3-phosphate acyltransferase